MPSLHLDLRSGGRRALRITVGLLAMALTATASAYNSWIDISGEVIEATCIVNGGNPDLVVALPSIRTSTLQGVGDTAGETPFQLTLTMCPQSMEGRPAMATFSSDSNIDALTNNLRAYMVPTRSGEPLTEHASVQIELTDENHVKILLGAANQDPPRALVLRSTATLNYIARYIRTADVAVGAGRITTIVNYAITYP